ncbi:MULTISPECIES: hypothetical protein [unclassified Paenarthrobacter]|uniref:hypothetical protein n=1 Tax=unclassified Paenarthrobacter TaxID=2634190 RepID=UPI003CF3C91D
MQEPTMQDRPVFPDFSAFQIDIPYSTDAHETLWPGGGHPDPDLYAAFWPDIGTPAATDVGTPAATDVGTEPPIDGRG